MMKLTLPIPPSVNHSQKQVRNGKRLMRVQSDATKQFKHDAHWLAFEWRQKTNWTVPEAGKKVIMRYWVFWPDKRKRDMDNLCKVMMDSLTDVVYEDDRYVLPQAMNYCVDRQNPRVEIEFELLALDGECC